jgi:peroxiredoxin
MARKSGRGVLALVLLLLLAGCDLAGTGIRRGGIAPDFSLEDMHGNKVTLSDFQGRPVLINFWASWCPPCRSEMPELQRVYAAQEADGLVILAVNTVYQDELDDVNDFVAEQKLTFPILLDSEGAVAVAYRASTLPTSVFVDRAGKIHLVQIGPMTQQFVESVLREME